MSDDYAYPGDELGSFAQAHNWKRYLAAQIRPFLGAKVLEVGAGIGGTTQLLAGSGPRRWTCLEPDADHVAALRERIAARELPDFCSVVQGTLSNLTENDPFDAILYIDVLEHISDDAEELRRAARHLAPRGNLVVMSPAHQWLFSPFDAAIGHQRRYSRRSLSALTPPGVSLAEVRYLDCVGLLASLGNRVLLSKRQPSLSQVLFWDRVLVRASTRVDAVLGHRVGKSILAVWKSQSGQ